MRGSIEKNRLLARCARRKLPSMRYGNHGDDFDDYGSSRGRDGDRDHDRDSDSSSDHERDVDTDHERDVDSERDRDGGGYGRARDDEDEDGLMTMTRRDSERDVRDLYNSSLDDMRKFLREREGAEDPMKSVTSNAVVGLEIAAGAALAGFLAQRFRQAGAVVPVGLTLAVLGLAAAQFNKAGKFSPDLRNVSFGALASAIALWAAGRAAISAEGFTFGPTATAGMLPAQTQVPFMFASPFVQPMQQPMPMQPPAFAPQQQVRAVAPPTVGRMDFYNLVAQQGGR